MPATAPARFIVPRVVRWSGFAARAAAVGLAFVLAGHVGAYRATAQAGPEPFVVPAWAFPTAPPRAGAAPRPDSVTLLQVPNSARRYTQQQVNDGFDIPDWFPAQHPPMPAPVRYGVRPDGRACGFCHLPDGQGRPENGALAGLPVGYAVRQVRAFRDGTRVSANPAAPTGPMHTVAKGFTNDDDIRAAALYFARIRLTRRNVIREVLDVPSTRIAGLLYAYDGEGTEPIAGRLIEVPEQLERHERRDPWVRYTTYVPVGSVARGQRIALRDAVGPNSSCASCHGPQLLGAGEVPPIAGRSPSMLLRQLIAFRTRARRDSTAGAMYPVVDSLSLDDMVALSAYVGGLPPTRPTRGSRK